VFDKGLALTRERLVGGAGIAEIVLVSLVALALIRRGVDRGAAGHFHVRPFYYRGDYATGLVALPDRMLNTLHASPFPLARCTASTLKSSVNPAIDRMPDVFELIGLVVVILGVADSIVILKEFDVP
jgi:hypothetical protein